MSSLKSRLRRILEDYTAWLLVDSTGEIDPEDPHVSDMIDSYVDDFLKAKGLAEPKHGSAEEAKRVTEILREYHMLYACTTCVNFDTALEMCKLAKLRPPADVIASGCPQWEGLPF